MAYETLNTSYAIPTEERGQQHPAIQASDYQPRGKDVPVNLVLSPASFDLLSDSAQALLPAVNTIPCYYGDETQDMIVIPDAVRWVPLGKPKLFKQDKSTGDVNELRRGDKFKGTNWRTATRLSLAAVIGHDSKTTGQVLLDGDGNPQIFTLKLTSSKTKLLSSRDAEDSTLDSLNQAILKHKKLSRMSLLHLVSVGLKAVPTKFEGEKDSSWGVMFQFDGGARELPEPIQSQMFTFVQSEAVKELLQNPFGIGAQPQGNNNESQPYAAESVDYADADAIPF